MVSSDVVFLGSMLSQARHFLCSKQDIPCVPSRTRLKNREDGSDFDDFWTESIATTRTFFSKIFAPSKNFRVENFSRRRKNFAPKGDVIFHVRFYERINFAQPLQLKTLQTRSPTRPTFRGRELHTSTLLAFAGDKNYFLTRARIDSHGGQHL